MKTLNQFLEQGGPQKEDPKVKQAEKKESMLKRRVLMAKMRAVRQGATGIMASHEPDGDQLNELKKSTLGSYVKKASKDLANRSFDQGESEKRMYEPDKEDEKETKKQATRQKGIDRAADKLAKEGYEPDGEMVEGVMKMIKSVTRKKKEKTAEKAMDAGARAKRKLARKVHAKYVSGSEDNVPDDIREAKVDAGKSPETKEKDRNVRKFGVSHNVAGHGKLRRALHRSNRGDKKIKGDKSAYVEMESVIAEKDLSAAERRALPDSDFALPGKGKGPEGKQAGSYPIPDATHARAALAMVAKYGTPEEKEKVRAAVRRKFPDIQQEAKRNSNRLVEPRDGVDNAKEVNRATRKAAFRPFNKEDKAYDYVVSKLKKKYGDGVLTKGDKIKPPTAAQKKANAAHQAKVDRENAADRKKDPSQGRYPPGYSNRGSD